MVEMSLTGRAKMAKYTVTLDGGDAGIAEFEVSAKSMDAAVEKIKPTTDWTIKCVMTESGRNRIYPNMKGTKVFADKPNPDYVPQSGMKGWPAR
jgi:hypothetical protein